MGRYSVGIDLGTTNTSLAYIDQQEPEVQQMFLNQVVSEGLNQALVSLPSAVYLPKEGDSVVGLMARRQASISPHRVILSAKSWLCQTALDRLAPILPFKSSIENKLSPLQAQVKILEQVINAWKYQMEQGVLHEALEDQEIVLTIPASFDPAARDLTLEAAKKAGLKQITLLEEPQAALYAWLKKHETNWREILKEGDTVLVCDIGGGTTDFSLIQVIQKDGELGLERLAVGNHILLGGDNMDLALRQILLQKLKKDGFTPDSSQLDILLSLAREAKEELLNGKDKVDIALAGSGSDMFSASIKTELTQQEMSSVVLDGFFAFCKAKDKPLQRPRFGLREQGLDYAQDPSIFRHLAAFLDGLAEPTCLLLNGSMFASNLLKSRVLEGIQALNKNLSGLRLLEDCDFAQGVSLGAAYFAWSKENKGIRIRASLPYSFYIGVEKAAMALPGVEPELSMLCIAPAGMEEGSEIKLENEEFYLVTDESVTFRLFRSNRLKPEAGSRTDWREGDFEEITSLEKNLNRSGQRAYLPVRIETSLNSVGTLEVYCQSLEQKEDRYQLEFNLRESQNNA